MGNNTISSVLFVCIGNVCRSPMAEAIFMEEAKIYNVADKWNADSAATGPWHVGCAPDIRVMEVLNENNIIYEHKARQMTKEDFYRFDFIFAMDRQNLKDINKMKPTKPKPKAQILLLGSFDPDGDPVIRDPYLDYDNRGFEKCYNQTHRCIKYFLDKHKHYIR